MRIIEIKSKENGSHRSKTFTGILPEGWAIMPDGFAVASTFPFVDIIVQTINGIPTVVEMSEREMPEPEPMPEPSPTIEDLVKENKLLRTKIDMQAENQIFLEECLLEMADIVYA